jgi:hypothetical protein
MKYIKPILAGLFLLLVSVAVTVGAAALLYAIAVFCNPQLWSWWGAGISAALSLLVPVVCLFTKWDTEPTPGSWISYPTIRGDLPKGFRWLQTTDERLPGGLYEPTVVKIFERVGKYWTSVYWLGLRNRAHGLRAYFAQPSNEESFHTIFQENKHGIIRGWRSDGTWYFSVRFFGFKLVLGHRVYCLLDSSFIAVPTVTLKRE